MRLGLVSIGALSLIIFTGEMLSANMNFKFSNSSGEGTQGQRIEIVTTFDIEKDDIEGWSIGVCHDGSLLTINSITNGSVTQGFNDGEGPDLYFPNVFPTGPEGPGWNAGVVISISGLEVLGPGNGYEIHIANYTVIGAPGEDEDPIITDICPCNEQVGDPVTPLVVVVGGFSFPVDANCGTATLNPSPMVNEFIRGDCNDDGAVDIGDGIFNINELFLMGPASGCPIACDANDDGARNIADSVYIWNYTLVSGPPPPAPFPGCGLREGQTPEDCPTRGCP